MRSCKLILILLDASLPRHGKESEEREAKRRQEAGREMEVRKRGKGVISNGKGHRPSVQSERCCQEHCCPFLHFLKAVSLNT